MWVGNSGFLTEIQHLAPALDAEASFERTGFVVDPGVQHAGVVAGLMGGDRPLLVDHGYQGPGLGELQGGGQADDPGADHRHIGPR